MAKKPLPQPSAGYNPVFLSEKSVKNTISIFNSHKIPLNQEQQERVVVFIRYFIWDRQALEQRPTLEACLNALKELQKAARLFEDGLTKLDERTEKLLIEPLIDAGNPGAIWDLRDKSKEVARNIWWLTKLAIERIKDKKDIGRADSARRDFIINLANIYEEIANNKPRLCKQDSDTPTGPFFKLVKDILVQLKIFTPGIDGATDQHNGPIYHAIKQALREREVRQAKEHNSEEITQSPL